MAVVSREWIRPRSLLSLGSFWHLEQTVTAAGVRITSCGDVLTPDDEIEYATGDGDPDAELCASCAAHDEALG